MSDGAGTEVIPITRKFWRDIIGRWRPLLLSRGLNQRAIDWICDDALRRCEAIQHRFTVTLMKLGPDCEPDAAHAIEQVNAAAIGMLEEWAGFHLAVIYELEIDLYAAKFGNGAPGAAAE